MFSHIIELTAKPGQAQQLLSAICDQAIPDVIKPAEGFVDQFVLKSETEPDRITSISFWESKQYGDLFFVNGFHEVSALTAPFLCAKPKTYELNVESSTNHRIRASGPSYDFFGDSD